MPVQDIYKFTEKGDDRRIVAGTITSGTIREGDEVLFLPSFKKSEIASIEGFNVPPRKEAGADEAIGVTLKTQIYIKPGEIMVKVNEQHPNVSSKFRANIFWVGKSPLVKNKKYKLKIGTMRSSVKLVEIISIIDAAQINIDTFKDQVERHDVAECIFETPKPIAFDIISNFEQTGRFVIVDNYDIAGGGIILESVDDQENSLKEHIRKREYLWEKSLITEEERREVYEHKSKFIVITTGSEELEKNIQDIGRQLEKRLFNTKHKVYFLGISSLLGGLGSNVSTENEDRIEQIHQIGELARIFTDSGQIFITSVHNLDDYEALILKELNAPNDILVVNIGESPFSNFIPDASVGIDDAVNEICNILVKQEIIIDYFI